MPDFSSRSRVTLVILLLAVAAAGLLAWVGHGARRVAVVEVGGQLLPCVSYAPFRRPGHSPFDPALVLAPEQIEDDLRRLRDISRCVRTYGLDHGLDAVPALARKLGLRVVLGAWIGRDTVANAAQLERALALAGAYRDVVDLLVVGNEVLLRRELAPQALAELLARARRAAVVPVAYADVWEFWLRHAEVLQPQVDVVAAHILPYWEDQPVALDQAVAHVHEIAGKLRRRFAPLPVWVAETGWPARGRQRGAAVPGVLQQAIFVRGLLAREAGEPLGFNLIEAYDQPWKRQLEGAMGGAWGVFDAAGERRLEFSGPVAARPDWAWPLLAGTLGGVLMLGLRWRRRAEAAVRILGGFLIGALAFLLLRELPIWSRDAMEWSRGAGALAACAICSIGLAARLAELVGTAPLPPRSGVRPSAGICRRVGAGSAWWLAACLFIAAADVLTVLVDGRYRPLLWQLYALPALLQGALALLGDRLPASAREERLLAAVIAIGVVGVIWVEGVANGTALIYAAVLMLLAVTVLWPHRRPASALGGTTASAASSSAGADHPAA